jgi:hypothetical protein
VSKHTAGVKRVKRGLLGHEWAWGDVGRRTVCGLWITRQTRRHAYLANVTVPDLGNVDEFYRCKHCERWRASIGTSSKPAAVAP